MQIKPCVPEFEKYGSFYEHPLIPEESGMVSQLWHIIPKHSILHLHRFNCEVFLEIQSGMATLIVGDTPEADNLCAFAMHRFVRLNPGVYFNLAALTPDISCKLSTAKNFGYVWESMDTPYIPERILPTVQITEILGYYYSVRNSGYSSPVQFHNYYELTYVDRGMLHTETESGEFDLKENSLIIYAPGQSHTQSTSKDGHCSYMTVIFNMELDGTDLNLPGFGNVLNRVFDYDKKIYALIKTLVNESTSKLPFSGNLMLCLLQEIILRLFQSEYIKKEPEHTPIPDSHQYYQNELLEKILNYIEKNIHEPLTISDLCHEFSLSRSSLQILFKDNMELSPKRYINDMKLELSRQMICENKYTISQIALDLGFNSIYYFSRAFSRKYHMSPSEYAKSLYKE